MTVDVASLVSDNLDIWTTVIQRKSGAGRGGSKRISLYGIERLRALILDLAVRGKLVPQDAADVPVGDLLSQIAAERQRRIKAGEIKSVKGPSKPSSEPYDIPSGWTWIPLWQTGNIFTGNSINSALRAELEKNQNGRPFVATKDVGYGLDPIDYDNGLIVRLDDRRFNIARPKSVLICAEGGSAGRKMAISDRDISFGNKLIANESWSQIEPRYILYTYLSDFFFDCFSKEMTGIIGGISRAKFLALPFPLPPLAEQRRIVAKVDELMALCDALEQESSTAMTAHEALVEALLSALTASTDASNFATNWERLVAHFDLLFTTDASINALKSAIVELAVTGLLTEKGDADFGKKPLRDLLIFGPKNGYSPRAVEHDTGIKSLSLSATTQGKFDGNQYKYVDIEMPEPEAELWLKEGDILIQRANSIDYVGVSALYEGINNQFIYPDLMMKIRFSNDFDPKFALICLNSNSTRKYFRSNASGTSGSMPKINQATVLNAELPTPSITQQRRIVAKVDELMALCDQLKSNLAEAAMTQKHLADAIVEKVSA
jgi:type I restriction enzyme, S subunit